jgi:hypothetical protein
MRIQMPTFFFTSDDCLQYAHAAEDNSEGF